MTRSSWLWGALAASTAAHALFAWQLASAPRQRRAPRDRDRFEVRMVPLPPSRPEPPAPEPLVPKPLVPEPIVPEPMPPAARKAKSVVKPTPPDAAPPPVAEAPPEAPAAEPTTAPVALLADTGAALAGGIVQLGGAPIAAWSRASPPIEAPRPGRGVARATARLAELADLSRKPKAPPLDAALRQNYPPELRRRGSEGQAEVRVVIDARGRVSEIATVSESARGFAEACRKTLAGSRWSEPIDREGRAVATRLTYRCRFRIER